LTLCISRCADPSLPRQPHAPELAFDWGSCPSRSAAGRDPFRRPSSSFDRGQSAPPTSGWAPYTLASREFRVGTPARTPLSPSVSLNKIFPSDARDAGPHGERRREAIPSVSNVVPHAKRLASRHRSSEKRPFPTPHAGASPHLERRTVSAQPDLPFVQEKASLFVRSSQLGIFPLPRFPPRVKQSGTCDHSPFLDL